MLDFKRLKKWLIWKFHERNEIQNADFDRIKAALTGKTGILNEGEKPAFTDMRVSYRENPAGDFVFVKNGIPITEQQLSSGESCLIMLVADLARRLTIATPLSKNPLKEGSGIVLIDEIDIHLHPKWQRTILDKLHHVFPQVQFIITTHSPAMVANCQHQQVNILKWDDSIQKMTVVHPKYSEGHSIEYILSTLMDIPTHNPLIDDYLALMRLKMLDTAKGKKLQKMIDKLDPNSPERMRTQFAMQRFKAVGK